MNIGHTLRQVRKAKGLTLRNVSKATGISLSFLSEIEREHSNPSQDTLSTLVEFYNIKIRLPVSQDDDARCLENLEYVLAEMRRSKPKERGEAAQCWAIAITQIELGAGYFEKYVVNHSSGIATTVCNCGLYQ